MTNRGALSIESRLRPATAQLNNFLRSFALRLTSLPKKARHESSSARIARLEFQACYLWKLLTGRDSIPNFSYMPISLPSGPTCLLGIC